MKISVIVPIYQVENYLRQCLDSILTQTYRELELILVDDGSPDACPQICDEYAAKDTRVKVIHKKNGGLSDARNAGIAAATGDYVMFVDGDDWLADKMDIACLAERAEESVADVISFSYSKIYEREQRAVACLGYAESMPLTLKTKGEQLQYLSRRGLYIASACNKLIRLRCLRENELFFAVGQTSEDVVWCLKLMRACHSLDYLNRDVYRYRQREGSISQTLNTESCRQLAQHIAECAMLAQRAEPDAEAYLIYTAYQFATFMKVQTFAETYPLQSIELLKDYAWLLRYHAGNRKLIVLRVMTRLLGYPNSCQLLYLLCRKNRIGG